MRTTEFDIKAAAREPADNPLLQACRRHLENDELELPTIPDVAYKIRRAINDENANSSKVARIAQIDPSITARLIKIANSPFYRGRKTIESCPEAITRIGLNAAQEIITAFSLKTVFTAKSPFIRHKMIELWTHSSFVAAISAVMAHKARGFDPDRAMLAGLIHDIGKVPILTFADQNGGLYESCTQLEEALALLHVDAGIKIVRQWRFPDDFADVIVNSENWHLDSQKPQDYAGIVMLAQLHGLIGKVDIKTLPKIDDLPAYQKLAGYLDACGSISVLDSAKEEIDIVWQMLA